MAYLAVGCEVTPSFACSDDAECDANGRCEITGYCSFPDPECNSGRRYGEYAGPYSGECASASTSDTEVDPSTTEGVTSVDPSGPSSTSADATTASGPDGSSSGSTQPVDDTTADSSSTTGDAETSSSDSSSTGEPLIDPLCFVDEFDDDAIGPYFAGYSLPMGTTLVESAGELVFGLAADPAFIVLESAVVEDRTDHLVRVELTQIPEASSTAQLMIGLAAGDERLLVQVTEGLVQARIETAPGEFTVHGTEVFQDDAHRWLQVRELDGVTHFESSADLATWQVLHSVATPFDITAAKTMFVAGTWELVADPGQPALGALHDCPS